MGRFVCPRPPRWHGHLHHEFVKEVLRCSLVAAPGFAKGLRDVAFLLVAVGALAHQHRSTSSKFAFVIHGKMPTRKAFVIATYMRCFQACNVWAQYVVDVTRPHIVRRSAPRRKKWVSNFEESDSSGKEANAVRDAVAISWIRNLDIGGWVIFTPDSAHVIEKPDASVLPSVALFASSFDGSSF